MTSSTAVKGQMKGLLKGLRYISQIFDEEEEHDNIEIGFPTDVKHVAHIGAENSSTTAPSWMNEFNGTSSEPSPGETANSNKIPEAINGDKKSKEQKDNGDKKSKEQKGEGKKSHHLHLRKPRQRSASTDSSTDSMPREGTGGEGSSLNPNKASRRNHSTESSKRKEEGGGESKPKHSHRRKSKTTASGADDKEGSSRPARNRRTSKSSLSDIPCTDLGPGSAAQ